MGGEKESISVVLKGRRLVWLKNDDGTGALAHPEHIDSEGNVRLEHVLSKSYAHVFGDGTICRYGQVIGTVDDLAVTATEREK